MKKTLAQYYQAVFASSIQYLQGGTFFNFIILYVIKLNNQYLNV